MLLEIDRVHVYIEQTLHKCYYLILGQIWKLSYQQITNIVSNIVLQNTHIRIETKKHDREKERQRKKKKQKKVEWGCGVCERQFTKYIYIYTYLFHLFSYRVRGTSWEISSIEQWHCYFVLFHY
jgi:hypothetical protein